MNKRIKNIFGQERHIPPALTTQELAELFGRSKAYIANVAQEEGWRYFECLKKDQYFYDRPNMDQNSFECPSGFDVETHQRWDVSSMPTATRACIAAFLQRNEEQEHPLIGTIWGDVEQVQSYFPYVKQYAIWAALYRARQFSHVLHVARSLRVPILDAMEAVAFGFGIKSGILLRLSMQFGGKTPMSFLEMDDDMRAVMLMLHFAGYPSDNALLPEFPLLSRAAPTESILQ